jgi:hypothetical protein
MGSLGVQSLVPHMAHGQVCHLTVCLSPTAPAFYIGGLCYGVSMSFEAPCLLSGMGQVLGQSYKVCLCGCPILPLSSLGLGDPNLWEIASFLCPVAQL